MDYRAIVAAACLATMGLSPVSAQSVQNAQRQIFACMQKAQNLGLKDDKKQEFITKCVEEADKSAAPSGERRE